MHISFNIFTKILIKSYQKEIRDSLDNHICQDQS